MTQTIRALMDENLVLLPRYLLQTTIGSPQADTLQSSISTFLYHFSSQEVALSMEYLARGWVAPSQISSQVRLKSCYFLDGANVQRF